MGVLHTRSSYRYSGLMVCGSVWHCPVCAARITEYRRVELRQITARHLERHGVVVMVTNTIPHERHDDMGALLARFAEAEKHYRRSKPMRQLRQQVGLIGTVRGLEWTYGLEHGAHPHTHNLWLLPAPVDHGDLQRALSALWGKACVKVGLRKPDPRAGLTVSDGRLYPAKWGLDHEMTKLHTKRGIKGLTPWDLLRWYRREANPQAAALFNEYARVFKGRRQLTYSPGLKTLYRIDEVTDQAIVEGTETDAVLVCQLSARQWHHICRRKARGAVLALAEHGGSAAVTRYLQGICPD